MTKSEKSKRICENGHVYYKSSDCPVCPVCESNRKPDEAAFAGLSAPARRALENQQIKTLFDLAQYSEKEILALHGIGPSAIPKLKAALQSKGLKFCK